MLEIGQTVGTSLMTSLGTGVLNSTAQGVSAPQAAPGMAPDHMSQSDRATFLAEYNKLDETEQREVVDFLDAYKEASDTGSDTTALMENIPDFLKRMLQEDVGGEDEATFPEYSSAVSGTYQRAQERAGGGGGHGVSGAQMVAGTLTALDSAEAGVVDESVEAANSAPSELQQLADDSGESLSSLLKQYLDAGLSVEAAYERVEADLRNTGGSEEESSEAEA
ncbi:MAG: hypothetical protein PHP44_01575 [Kiritimatiellae bacterium]|nr:hypothetical protein [Kiritimatiellia bacterium]